MEYYITAKFTDHYLIRVLVEKLDTWAAPMYKSMLVGDLDDSVGNIIMDFSECRYCDSGGLSVINIANRLAKYRQGKLVLFGLHGAVERILVVHQLDKAIPVAESYEEAVARLHEEPIIKTYDFKDDDELTMEATSRTPFIWINSKSGEIILKGRFLSAIGDQHIKPVFDFIDQKLENIDNIDIRVELECFTVVAGRDMLDLFKRIKRLYQKGTKVRCKWLYDAEDEDMLGAGKDYQRVIKFPFEFVPVADENPYLS